MRTAEIQWAWTAWHAAVACCLGQSLPNCSCRAPHCAGCATASSVSGVAVEVVPRTSLAIFRLPQALPPALRSSSL
ncbi:hypothetical protein C8R45DRAFT_1016252 [Mycena sanguinolenta]|nr:hypothetical protein C8R45DRAFT_1016252 [Mycena sanguinolenta]